MICSLRRLVRHESSISKHPIFLASPSQRQCVHGQRKPVIEVLLCFYLCFSGRQIARLRKLLIVDLVQCDSIAHDIDEEGTTALELIVHVFQAVHDEIDRCRNPLRYRHLAKEMVVGLGPIFHRIGQAIVVDDDEDMADTLSRAERGMRMALIRGRDTKPEMIVRRMLHAMGYRYRLQAKDLPGKPDIVFRGRKKVIFVHGCFWHRHPDPTCKLARLPKSRLDFWEPKLEGNRVRDENNVLALEKMGWDVLVLWECELRDQEQLGNKLSGFVGE